MKQLNSPNETLINEQLSESIGLIGRMQKSCARLCEIVDALPEDTPADTIVKLANSLTSNIGEIAKASETLVNVLRALNTPGNAEEDDEYAGMSTEDILSKLSGGEG